MSCWFLLIYLGIILLPPPTEGKHQQQCHERSKTTCPAAEASCTKPSAGTCKTDTECPCPQRCCVVKCKHTCSGTSNGSSAKNKTATPMAAENATATNSTGTYANVGTATQTVPRSASSAVTNNNTVLKNDSKSSTRTVEQSKTLPSENTNLAVNKSAGTTLATENTTSVQPRSYASTKPAINYNYTSATTLSATENKNQDQTNITSVMKADNQNQPVSQNLSVDTLKASQKEEIAQPDNTSNNTNESLGIIPRSASGQFGNKKPFSGLNMDENEDMVGNDYEPLNEEEDNTNKAGIGTEEISEKDQLIDDEDSLPRESAKKKKKIKQRKKLPQKQDDMSTIESGSGKPPQKKNANEPLNADEKELMKRLRLKMRRTQHAQTFERDDGTEQGDETPEKVKDDSKQEVKKQKIKPQQEETYDKLDTLNAVKGKTEAKKNEDENTTDNKERKKSKIESNNFKESLKSNDEFEETIEKQGKKKRQKIIESIEDTVNVKKRKKKLPEGTPGKSLDDYDANEDIKQIPQKKKNVGFESYDDSPKEKKMRNKNFNIDTSDLTTANGKDNADVEDDLYEQIRKKAMGNFSNNKRKPLNKTPRPINKIKYKNSENKNIRPQDDYEDDQGKADILEDDNIKAEEDDEFEFNAEKPLKRMPKIKFPKFGGNTFPPPEQSGLGLSSEIEGSVPKAVRLKKKPPSLKIARPTIEPTTAPEEDSIMKHRNLILEMLYQIPQLLQKSVYRQKTVPPMVVKLPNGEYIYAPPKPGYDARPLEKDELKDSENKEEDNTANKIPFTTSWNKFVLNAKPFGTKAPGNYPYPIVMAITDPDDIFNMFPEQTMPSFSQYFSHLELPFYVRKGFQKDKTEPESSETLQ